MLLTEKEMSVLKDLQTQEKNCIDKYEKYAGLAKDDELKQLFEELKKKEQEHYKTIGQILNGEVPSCDCRTISQRAFIQIVKSHRIKIINVFLQQSA